MNKFIILGCGYLGTNISNYISKIDDTQVYVLGIENEYNDYLEKNIIFIPKMIEQISEEDLEMFEDSIVIDAVGNINATNDSKNSTTVFLNNCASKVNLIQKLNKLKIKKYVFLSSGGTVYNDSDVPHIEDESLNPVNVYALEKVIIEDYLKIFGMENNGFSYLILRLSNPYGGIVSKTKKQGIIDVSIRKLKNKEEMDFFGEIDNIRDYIYVENVAEYIYKISILNYCNSIYNIGSGKGTSIRRIFDILEKEYNGKINLKIRSSDTVNIKTNILNVNKIRNIIKIDKIYDIEEGISLIKKTIHKWG